MHLPLLVCIVELRQGARQIEILYDVGRTCIVSPYHMIIMAVSCVSGDQALRRAACKLINVSITYIFHVCLKTFFLFGGGVLDSN